MLDEIAIPTEVVTYAIALLAGVVLFLLILYVFPYMRTLSTSAKWQAAIDVLEAAARFAVRATQQKIVDGMKQAAGPDGKLTIEEGKYAMIHAEGLVDLQIHDAKRQEIRRVLHVDERGLQTTIRTILETEVHNMKAEQGTRASVLDVVPPPDAA